MKEFSMHILDIAQNSTRAGADRVLITLDENIAGNRLVMEIADNGSGMSDEMVESIRNPFTTSRTTRKVGLGIPMLEQTCIQCGGFLDIKSKLGEGTIVHAEMEYNNLDRPPLGDVGSYMHILIVTNPDIDFKYLHRYNGKEYELDVRELREVLEGVPINEPSVMDWIKQSITEGLSEIKEI